MASSSPTPTEDRDALSIPASLLYRLGLPITIGALCVYSPATALFAPIVAAPSAFLLSRRSSQPPAERPGKLETLIWTFLSAATLAPAASMLAQGVLSYGSALLVFGDKTKDYITEFSRSADDVRSLPPEIISKRRAMAHSLPYLAYLVFFSFSLAGLPEEACKYAILRYIQRQHDQPGEKRLTAREYILYATTIGLGFSFFENLGFIYAAAASDTRNMLLVTAAERILYGTAAHVLTAVLTGARMARGAKRTDTKGSERGAPIGWFRTILPSMLYHGAGDAALLAACALDGHPGWVHPDSLWPFLKYVIAPVTLMTGLGVQVGSELQGLGIRWFGL